LNDRNALSTAELDLHAALGPMFADVTVGLDGANSKLDRMCKAMEHMARRGATPVDYRPVGQVIIGAAPSQVTTAGLINLGSPDQGHVWLLRNLMVVKGGDGQVGTTLGGNIFVYSEGAPPNLAHLSVIGLRDGFAATAFGPPRTYSSRQIVVKAEEYLWVAITGSTQNFQAVAEACVEDYQEAAYRAAFEI
jgi:hypothetical protein